MEAERSILHCDLNGFYAAVECLMAPHLRDVPMAVCGDPKNRHGIILAKNECAKAYDIKTAETIYSARKKCPGLTLVPPRHDLYSQYSRKAHKIYLEFTNQVEPFGIDEAWLDVTGSYRLFGGAEKIADRLRELMKERLGLTISVGVSFNKIFAKLGSDYKKPDATTVINRQNYREILYPLPVGAMLFVGGNVRRVLSGAGINTIGELAAADREMMFRILKSHGRLLHDYANGRDSTPVSDYYDMEPAKSVGNGMTFRRDIEAGSDDLKLAAAALSDKVGLRLRANGLSGRVVHVSVKSPEFKVITRQRVLEQPTSTAKTIQKNALGLIGANFGKSALIRTLTITVGGLLKDGVGEQISLFDSGEEREKKLERTIDDMKKKYGKNTLFRASQIGNDLGIEMGEEG